MKTINLISVVQPIGTFLVGKMKTEDLLVISYVRRQTIDNDGIQRELDVNRANKIDEYLNDPDATFPTAIIISMSSDDIHLERIGNDFFKMSFDETKKESAEVIDGQHRIEGIRKNPSKIEELPIVIMLDMSQEEKAYVFSIINSNQKQVSKSQIYNLFGLYEGRSPTKTCHTIVKSLNSDPKSPFFERVKMLGKKTLDSESISQGMFVDFLLRLMTNNKESDEIKLKNGEELDPNRNLVLRQLFIEGKDEVIYKILLNYFSAIAEVFPDEWNDNESYILTKTTGIGAFCKAFGVAFRKGIEKKELTKAFFLVLMRRTKEHMEKNQLYFDSDMFGSGESAQKRLQEEIIEEWN